MRYIIARGFQLKFSGIVSGDHVLYLNLIHSGRAVLNSDTHLDAPGAVHIFNHRPRVKMYKIDCNLNVNDWLDVKQIKTLKLTFEGRFLGPGRRLNWAETPLRSVSLVGYALGTAKACPGQFGVEFAAVPPRAVLRMLDCKT